MTVRPTLSAHQLRKAMVGKAFGFEASWGSELSAALGLGDRGPSKICSAIMLVAQALLARMGLFRLAPGRCVRRDAVDRA